MQIETLSRRDFDREAARFASTPFHESRWIEAVAQLDSRPAYFAFRSTAGLVAVAAGVAVAAARPLLSSVAKYFYMYGLPPILSGAEPEVFDHLRQHLRTHGFNTLELAYYCNPPEPRVGGLGLVPRSAREYRIDLTPPAPELFSRLNRMRRRLIKRATAAQLVYQESQDPRQIGDLLLCLRGTRQRRTEHGVGAYGHYYIRGLNDNAVRRLLESGLGRVCTVSQDGHLMSAGFLLRNTAHTYYVLAGSTAEGYAMEASSYMQWCVLEQSKSQGCHTLNLGGIPKDESADRLVFFKESFGAKAHDCEGGTCYLLGSVPQMLHRGYKVIANPRHYLSVAARRAKGALPSHAGH